MWMTWASGMLMVATQGVPEDEGACRVALEEFRAGLKNASESSRAQAALNLVKHPCPKAIAGLAALLSADVDAVRIAAAKALGAMDEPKAVEAVALSVPANTQKHEVLEALAKALERLDWEAGALALNPLLPKHHDPDVLDTLHIVVSVLGRLGSPTSVEPLIKLLEHAENEGKRVRAAGVRAAGNPKMGALEGLIRKALQDITGGSAGTADKWEDWWKGNRERLLQGAFIHYRCKATGKRWGQKLGESQECPHHDRPEKDGVPVKTSFAGAKKP